MTAPQRWRTSLIAAARATLLGLAGCVTVPTSGPVERIERAAAEPARTA